MKSVKSKTPPDGRVRAPIRSPKTSKPGWKDSAAWLWLPAIAMTVTSGVMLTPSPAKATQTFSVNDTNGVNLNTYLPETVFHLNANTTISNAVTYGIKGGAGYGWTFTNNGTITGTGAAGLFFGDLNFVNYSDGRLTGTNYGLAAIGALSLTNSGTIAGSAETGVRADVGGTVTNNSAALISGYNYGVTFGTGSAALTNSGNISGGIAGVLMGNGGTVTNTGTAARIAGNSIGVRVNAAAGFVSNEGTIIATGSTAGNGIYLLAGGSINNSGTITGFTAIRAEAAGILTLTNTGVVNGSTASNGIGVTMGNNGIVTNSGTAAYISGGKNGVYIGGASGIVTNEGTIKATSSASGNGKAGILLKAGTVTNSGTASLISGAKDGVYINAAEGFVTNQGTITSGRNGVRLQYGGAITNGGTANSTALISGYNSGVSLYSGGILNNFGTISSTGGAGVYLYSGGTVSNSGTISSGYDGIRLINGGNVSNSGSINGGYRGVYLYAGGTVSNTGTITSNDRGIQLYNGGSLTNGGLITGGYRGVFLYNGGIVTNTGSIHGVSTGIYLGSNGSVSNSGTITGDDFAILVTGTGTVTNSGSLNSNSTGIYLSPGSTASNSGTITSGYTGVYINGGTLNNTGLIDGTVFGVYLYGGTVFNSGVIKDGAGLVHAGIYLQHGAVVTNNTGGSLIGTDGARLDGTSTLTNFGTITTLGTDAVKFSGSGGVLILGTGSKINGAINGGGGTVNRVNLTGSGTLTSNLTNFGAGSTLTLASGASWTASGSWTMPTVTNSGTLQPGVAGTPLNVTGNFTQGATGVLKSVLTSSGGASLLNITGTATLAGSVAVTPPGSIPVGTQKYTIVTASAGVSGSFASVSGGTALLVPSLSYDANNAFVTLTQQAVAAPTPTPDPTKSSSSQSGNENAFAKAFDAAYAANPALFAPILGSLNQIKSQDDLNTALNQLTGENAAAVTNMIQSQVSEFLSQFQQHSQGTMGVTEVDDPWITGFIQSGTFKGNGNANQITETAWGVTAGADHVISPGFRLGVMGGMGQQHSNTGGGAGSARVWYEQVAATADYSDGNWYLNGMVGMSFNHGSTMRAISLPGISATALGHLTSTQGLASGQVGYGIPLDAKFTLVPFLGVDISVTNQDAYAETGAGLLNLTFAGRTINNQRSILGARLKGAEVDIMGLPLNTELKMGWAHQFAAVNPAAVAAFASVAGPTFTVTGVPLARNAGVIGLGLSTAVASNASIHLRYDGEFSGISSSNTVSFGLAVDW